MAKIKAFKAVRPTRDKAHLVASRSYLSYSKQDLHNKLSENPYSFIHIINPDFGDGEKTEANSDERFRKIKEKYTDFLRQEILVGDSKNSLYIYRQFTPSGKFTGIIGCADTDEYFDGSIKKHEHTIQEREETFKNYLDVCNFNAEPVLLTYPKNESVDQILARYTNTRPEYDFSTTDKVRHQLWVVDNPEHLQKIAKAFNDVDALYIADGHHRCASSALLAKEREENQPNPNGMYKSILSYFISDEQLQIQPFHRLVRFPDAETMKYIIDETIRRFGSTQGDVMLCDGKNCFFLEIPEDKTDVLSQLLPEKLTRHILDPIFGISDLRTDPRIDFYGGNIRLNAFQEKVSAQRLTVGFYLKPVSAQELFDIADKGEVMPPKSTYIEPKLRSGLTILEL